MAILSKSAHSRLDATIIRNRLKRIKVRGRGRVFILDIQSRMGDPYAFYKDNLANYKVPAAMKFVKELPKSATGKILKRILGDEDTETGA